jgi:hypothetical protein
MALIYLHRKVLRGQKQFVDKKANTCASLKGMLLAVKEDTELLRSRLSVLKGDAATGKEEDKSGIQELETWLKLVITVLQELSEVHDGTMKQVVVCNKLLSTEQESGRER